MPQERRIFENISSSLSIPVEMEISEENFHHLIKVLRLKPGAQIVVAAKDSPIEYKALLVSDEKPARIKLISTAQTKKQCCKVHTLIFALTKGERNDLVCEKACELGVEKIIFWQAERSVVKISDLQECNKKIARWNKIAESAAKQSHRTTIPSICLALDFNELISALKESLPDKLLCCSLASTAQAIKDIPSPKGQVAIIIGPEGDFTKEEEQKLIDFGFEPITLGENILRSETAAIAAIAMANGIWD